MADRVTVIGWDGSPLTAAARSALVAATLVAGAAHHLALPEVPEAAERIRLGSVALAARRIAAHRGTAVVLADGDPGFFGVVRTLRAPRVRPRGRSGTRRLLGGRRLRPGRHALGRRPDRGRPPPHPAPRRQRLPRAPQGRRPHLARRGPRRTRPAPRRACTAPSSSARRSAPTANRSPSLTSDKAADHTWRDPNVVIVIGGFTGAARQGTAGSPAATRRPVARLGAARRGLRRRGAEGDRASLRAAQLARLGPRVGDLVWDIGCGSGA